MYNNVVGPSLVLLSNSLLETSNGHHRVHSHFDDLLILLVVHREDVLHVHPAAKCAR